MDLYTATATITGTPRQRSPRRLPSSTARVTDPSGAQELQIRKSKDLYLAKSSAVEGIYKVNTELAAGAR